MGKREEEKRLEQYKKILEKSGTMLGETVQKTGGGLEASVEYVLGPALNSFIFWVLNESLKKSIQRLYFLSRDGYFMYRCAESFCEKQKLEIQCRYLCCSRYSVRLPFFQFDTEKALDYICRDSMELTVDKILGRAGLDAAEKTRVLEEIPILRKKEKISRTELPRIRELLKNSSFFIQVMKDHSRKAYPGLKNYLIQEGLLEEKKMAFVDSGWVGSMQMVLNQILQTAGKKEMLPGYYWGLYEIPEEARRKDYFCYFFSPEQGLKEKVFFSNNLFEAIFTAPHGMTIGYRAEGERIYPVYGNLDGRKKTFLHHLEGYLEAYTKRFLELPQRQTRTEIKRQKRTVKKLLRLFMGKPVKAEARRFGRLSFSDEVTDQDTGETAVYMTKREIRQNHIWRRGMILLGWRKEALRESPWYEGSVARYGHGQAWHWFLYRLYKYLLYTRQKYQYLKSRERQNEKGR